MTRDEIISMALDTGFDSDDETTLTSLERFAALVAAAEREAGQRAFWEACRPHGKVGEVVYTTYKHLRARSEP